MQCDFSYDFGSLMANLSEIETALHTQQNLPLPLYAPSRFQVRFVGCFMGKTIQVFDQGSRWLLKNNPCPVKNALEYILQTEFDHAVHHVFDARQRRIWNSMRQIDDLWMSQMSQKDWKEQEIRYDSYLKDELEGSQEKGNPLYLKAFKTRQVTLLSEPQEKKLRHLIVNFEDAARNFWSAILKDKREAIPKLLPLLPPLAPGSTLFDRPLYKAIKKEGRWVEMEGLLQQSIPIGPLSKLTDPQSLTLDEKGRLNRWVEALNQNSDAIPLKLLSKVLSEIASVIELQGSSPLTLPDLLEWLDKEGCKIIHLEDPSHMDWREQLTPGDTIECNGTSLILGRQLSPEKLINDTYKVFELKNFPDYVVKIAHNRFLLLLEDALSRSDDGHWGVRLAETVESSQNGLIGDFIEGGLDRLGHCAVIEKLSSPLAVQVWTSQKMILSDEDEKKALVLANHFFCISQWNGTVEKLSFSHLMWDKEGVLKTSRPLKKGPPNYNKWEENCIEAARGNFYVLSYLMHVSNLAEHAIAAYYRGAVEYTLKTGKTDLIGRPLPKGHRLDVYTERVEKLCQEAIVLRDNCLKTIVAHLRKAKQYNYHQQGQIMKAISLKLLEFYKFSPTPGSFSKDLENQVVLSFAKTSTQKSIVEDPAPYLNYYEAQNELMMDYNLEFDPLV